MLREVTLEGTHVRLEPLRREHAKELEAPAAEPDLWRYLGRDASTPEKLARWVDDRLRAVEAGATLAFLQRDARTGAAFGSTSLFEADLANRRIEIGHTWIGASHRRTAANTEAKLILLTHAFESLGMNRVQLKTDARNLRSQSAIERLGAKREGTLRSYVVYEDGSVTDRVMYSIVRAEWPDVRARLLGLLAAGARRDAKTGL